MKAYELIEKGWCQEVPAVDENGWAVRPHDKKAVAWCIDGALVLVYGKKKDDPVHGDLGKGSNELYAKRGLLKSALKKDGWWRIVRWNDTPGRTQAEAVALLKGLDI